MSSGSFVIEFVPKFSSTIFVHVPRSSGNCVWKVRQKCVIIAHKFKLKNLSIKINSEQFGNDCQSKVI